MTTMAFQRHLHGSLLVIILMSFNKDDEEKESRKDKDQINKNTLKINDGISYGYLLLG